MLAHTIFHENNNTGLEPGNGIPKKKIHDAKLALKEYGTNIPHSTYALIPDYHGCKECAWYSVVFYHQSSGHVIAIENDEGFEIVKGHFVDHMNEAHPDVCARKMSLNNAEKYT